MIDDLEQDEIKPLKVAPTAKELKKIFYIDQKVFLKQLQEYYENDKMTNLLAENVKKIAEGLSYNWRFINYTRIWKEEMVGDAIHKMYAALEAKKFKIDSGYNPFSYFNMIAWNSFSNRIKKEKKQHDGLKDYKDRVYMESMSDPDSQGHVYVRPIMDGDENDCDYGDD